MSQHFDSLADVRSITQLQGRSPLVQSQGLLTDPSNMRYKLGIKGRVPPAGLSYSLARQRSYGCSAVGWDRTSTMASMVSRGVLQSVTFAPTIAFSNGPLSMSTDFLALYFPRSVEFSPADFPPKPSLAQPPVVGVSFPLDTPEFLAFTRQSIPGPFGHAVGAPAQIPVVGDALGAKHLGRLPALASRPHSEDDAVEGRAPVCVVVSLGFARPECLEGRLDSGPDRWGQRGQGRPFPAFRHGIHPGDHP